MTREQTLEGPVEAQQRQVPRWAAPFLGVGGAVVGGLYVVFMPVIFPAMLLYYAGVKVVRLVRGGADELAARAEAKARAPERRPPP
jgi:hypothetical protein